MPIYSAKPPPLNQDYYVFNAGEPEGPYDLPFIEAMVISALLAPDVSVSKDGKTGWHSLTTLVPPQSPKKSYPTGGTNHVPPPTSFQAPEPKKESRVGRWVLGSILVLVAIGYANSGSSTPHRTYQAPNSTYVQPPPLPFAAAPAPAPVYQPPVYTPPPTDTSSPLRQPDVTPEAPTADTTPPPPPPAPLKTYDVRDSSGRTFRVSHSDYIILGQKETALGQLKNAIDRLKTARAEENQIIETQRAGLDNTDQAAVDEFNTTVDQYNTSGATIDREIDEYNSAVDDHNQYLLRVGTPEN